MGDRYWLRLGGRLLLGVIIIGWAASYLTTTGSGEKEFQKALDAMKQVHTFRVASSGTPAANIRMEMVWEVDCTRDILHHQMHQTVADAPDFNQDWTDVNNQEYSRKPDGSWSLVKGAYQGATAKLYCARLAQGEDSGLLPQIPTMIKRGIIQKGDKKTVNGVRCREWLVTLRGGTSGLEHDTVCLGVDDHLPYEMTMDSPPFRSTFSDYNAALSIELPQAELQSASAPGGSN